MDPDIAGCVVVFDNEDLPNVSLDARTISFYTAMFQEMQLPGPAEPPGSKDLLPAIRPGFYSRPLQAPQILAAVPDLFFWICDPPPRYKTDPQTKKKTLLPPFSEVQNRVELSFDWAKIPLVQVAGGRSSIPLGHQFYIYENLYMPTKPLQGLAPAINWDFNSSFARDPRYPHGDPRFRVQGNRILRGTFRKADFSMAATVTLLDTATASKPSPIGGELLEPEAPLIFFSSGEIFSISNSGKLVSSKPNQSGGWTSFADNSQTNDPLRRLRALHVEARGTDAYLFYISKTYQLVTKRRIGNTSWSNPAVLGQVAKGQAPNQLTNMAVTSSQTSVDVFYINSDGMLTTSSPLLSTSSAYPAQNCLVLERTPTLLVGTALAAVCPTNDFILVFGISRQLNLAMAVWQRNTGWSALAPIGTADDRLFAHSRLSAFFRARNRAVVYVGGISDTNVPCVYTIRAQNRVWILDGIQQYPQKIMKPPKNWQDPSPNGPLGPAFNYDVNPFGDVGLFEDAQGTVFAITGAQPSGGAVLVNHIGLQSSWQSIR